MDILSELGKNTDDILALLRVYEDVENVHIVTEFCEGELLEHLYTSKSLSEHDIAGIICKLIQTLKKLHDHGEASNVV